MSNWILFVLTAELIWAFTSFFDKIILSKGHIKNPFVFVVFNGAMNVFLLLLLPFFDFNLLSRIDIFIALTAGLLLTLGIVLYYKAVQYEEISRVLMMWQLIPIFVLIMSFYFLNEPLTKKHFLGFVLLFTAGLLVAYRKINGKFKLSKAFYLMLGSTLLISFYYVASKHIYKITDFWNAFMWLRIAAFSGVLVLIEPSIRKEFIYTLRNMNSGIKGLLGFKMIVDFSAFIFLGFAILNGPISLVSALGSATAPVFIFFITFFTTIYLPHIVKEDINKKTILIKALAILLIIVGIFLVNI